MTTRVVHEVATHLRSPGEAIAYLTALMRKAHLDWLGYVRALRDIARAIPGMAHRRKNLKAVGDTRIDLGEVTTGGTSVQTTGPCEWQAKIGKIPVAVA